MGHYIHKVKCASPLLWTTSCLSKAGNERGPGEVKFWNNSEESDFDRGLKEGPRIRENKDVIPDRKPFTRQDTGFMDLSLALVFPVVCLWASP